LFYIGPRNRNDFSTAQFLGTLFDHLPPRVIKGRPISWLKRNDERFDDLKSILIREGQDGLNKFLRVRCHFVL
jgi:hypothetical protein